MSRYRTQRGSALLIVLGMLSFMVVSAVSFAIYMRASRTPSSYLRRNLAARSLVRAALAKAVEDLEGGWAGKEEWGLTNGNAAVQFYGVYDDPFPGSGRDASQQDRDNGDLWYNRVFCPFGRTSFDSTTPVLTLEALAYLPPSIVDDVRYESRFTRTAMWHSFPYEAGRYAYCAVNVSDLFDVNRLGRQLADDAPRNSSANGRVSLASLCWQSYDDPTTIDNGKVTTLRTLVQGLENDKWNGNVVPFTSMADFNVFAGSGNVYAPFCSFIGSSGDSFFQGNASMPANALFITDTWFPPTNTTAGTSLDLAANQPFSSADTAESLLSCYNKMNAATKDYYEKRLGVGIGALYDYLDEDSVPCSLAFPTVEEVPMIAGISAPAGIQPTIGNIGSPVDTLVQNLDGQWIDNSDPTKVTPVQVTITRSRQLKGFTSFGNVASAKVLATYPFKRMQTKNLVKNFTLRGLMRVYLAADGMGCRPDSSSQYLYPAKDDWWKTRNSGDRVQNGIATFYASAGTAIYFSSDILRQTDAVKDLTLNFSSSDLDVQMPLYWEVTEKITSPDPASNPGYTLSLVNTSQMNAGPYKSLGDLSGDTKALRPLTANGNGVEKAWSDLAKTIDWTKDYESSGLSATDPTSLTAAYRFYAALWLQVVDSDNKVVDMVPAKWQDDVDFLEFTSAMANVSIFDYHMGDKVPLMNFETATDFKFSDAAASGYTPAPFSYDQACQSLYVADPRYNFAPENWYASSDATPSGQNWLQELKTEYFSKNVAGLARDIFMFVSNQEYLQSVGELQFLPSLHREMDLVNPTGKFDGGTGYSGNFTGRALKSVTSLAALKNNSAHGNFFWRTYYAYANADDINPYLAFPFTSGEGGFKLNPYSRDDRVHFAAVCGTPFDYYMTSTNDQNNLTANLTLQQMNDTYAFGPGVNAAKLSKEDLIDVVAEIKDGFADCAKRGDRDWQAAWDDLEWQVWDTANCGDENKMFMGIDNLQDPLHEVDRKFLYSFWRDCYDNRQQLFLVFVRAEPSSVGGGGSAGKSVSSQLGGRAVALVWRDPEPPRNNNAGTREDRAALRSNEDAVRQARRNNPPHRTRVLFYHQFD